MLFFIEPILLSCSEGQEHRLQKKIWDPGTSDHNPEERQSCYIIKLDYQSYIWPDFEDCIIDSSSEIPVNMLYYMANLNVAT